MFRDFDGETDPERNKRKFYIFEVFKKHTCIAGLQKLIYVFGVWWYHYNYILNSKSDIPQFSRKITVLSNDNKSIILTDCFL